ncbi:MAG: pantoate--beta-alanine ligase [Acidobacteria bacterium]|nr:pantoate--beta-alanine ligase [Acidobacteriota bacterium]
MRLISNIADMQSFSREARAQGKSLGLVPTMGALHAGHLSLVRRARGQCDVVVVSIFVNPAQFGPGEDISRYPRDIQRDFELLGELKIEAVFVPASDAMYPAGFETYVTPGGIGEPLEGAARLGHFRGVATIVLKLFNIVNPDIAYFGQKDFQQVQVIRRLVEDLNLPVRLVVCPIVREADGLAKSSRNAYLNAEERQAATILHRSLARAERLAHAGETSTARLIEEMQQTFASEPRAHLDYAAIVEPSRFTAVARVSSGCVVLVAARIGQARLIDNLILGPPGESPDRLIQLALTSDFVASPETRPPGLEIDLLKQKIEVCRDCAAVAAIRLPPSEFLAKYLRRYYPDLAAVRVAIIARDSPLNADNYLYRHPENITRFTAALYELIGVANFEEFRARFVLTDALRCHCTGPRVPERAVTACAKFLPEELQIFPLLTTILVLGEDAYVQFQRNILGRRADSMRSFYSWVGAQGWAEERVELAALDGRNVRVIYAYHPTLGYRRSPSLASHLA